jgi:hypothetical protein
MEEGTNFNRNQIKNGRDIEEWTNIKNIIAKGGQTLAQGTKFGPR